MKRLSTVLAVLLAAACGGSTKPAIQLFVAQPGQVSLGGTTYLVVAASPANATLTIDNGVGDVTGQTQVAVSPTADTTYTLTAQLGGASVTATVAVKVTAARPSAFKVEPTTAGTIVAGAAATYFVSAVDATGAVNPNYRGTVHFISDDPKAVVPADATFTAANAGKVSATVTFKSAGSRSLVAIDSSVSTAQGAVRAVVSPAAAASLALSGVPDSPTAGDRLAVVVTALDAFGNVATGYTGTVHFTSGDATARLPADYTFTAADKGARPFGAAFTKAAPATIAVAATVAGVTGATGTLSVKHAAATAVTLEGVPATVDADSAVVVTVTVRDVYGNPITDYAGRLHLLLTDGAAPALPDLVFNASMFGTADVTTQFFTAADQSIIVTDAASASITGSAATRVRHGGPVAYVLSALPAGAVAGDPLPLTITVVDAHGNLDKDYTGAAHVSSADFTDRLPADGAFTGGIRTVSVAFLTAGPHTATVSDVAAVIAPATTTTVAVVAGNAKAFAVAGGSSTAGNATSTTVTASDAFGNTVLSYSGTVALSSSDAQFAPPAPYTFTSVDAGTHAFPITLYTAGSQTVTATGGIVSGTGTFAVGPANGAACAVVDAPASAAAGSQVGLRVVVKDAYSNVATGYLGTMALSSSDASAQLGGNGTFTATDAGSHAFSVQLRSAGNQTITATDTATGALTCSATVAVVAGATVLVVTFPPGDAWAGTPVTATVAAQDAFGNAAATYAGTVAFTSSDALAVKPGSVVFAAGDAPKTVGVTFNSVGSQTLTATDTLVPAVQGTSRAIPVHGLVYTNPSTGGKVRLVLNAASNASGVQLDLVSNATLFAVSAGTADTVRHGAFAAGLNLPLDVTKVGADTPLLVTTAPGGSSSVLTLGAAPQAIGAAINAANGVLYSGISQKRTEVPPPTTPPTPAILRGDVSVRPFPGAASYYYSLRLKLTPGALPGTVFDGQNLSIKYHAAIRDRSGSDVFSGPDFAIGKLEIR